MIRDLEQCGELTILLCLCCWHQSSPLASFFQTCPRKFFCTDRILGDLLSVATPKLISMKWRWPEICPRILPMSAACIIGNRSLPRFYQFSTLLPFTYLSTIHLPDSFATMEAKHRVAVFLGYILPSLNFNVPVYWITMLVTRVGALIDRNCENTSE